jgi:hypothetical protein
VAAIDYSSIPESTRQSLLAVTYKMAVDMFKNPAVEVEYQEWLAKRRTAEAAENIERR